MTVLFRFKILTSITFATILDDGFIVLLEILLRILGIWIINTSVPRAMFASSRIVLSSASTSYYYVVYNSVALTDTTCDMIPSVEADKQTTVTLPAKPTICRDRLLSIHRFFY